MSEPQEIADLKQQCADLRKRGTLHLAGLVIASLTLTAYLAVQAKRTGSELAQVKEARAQLAEAFKKNDAYIGTFVGKLNEYSKTHPELGTILAKYIKDSGNAAGAAQGVPVPAPQK